MKFTAKKMLTTALSLLMAATMLSGCGKTNDVTNDGVATGADAVVTEAVVAKQFNDVTAAELAKSMKIGWNVGNCLDAYGKTGLEAETAWGNPKITKELIDAAKAAGFDTIRVPVTWVDHIDADYKIDDEWFARVKEVVDYVIDNDMYAIINIHHDGNDTAAAWLSPEPKDEEAMIKQFTVLWEQIGAYFKDYNEKLLFAGMNELHHGYNNPTDEYLRITDRLNQTFVDTVRKTGGNNDKRILVCQAYNTTGNASLKMIMPTDTVKDKLMMEFHFYDPWDFAGEGKGDWGINGTNKATWGQEAWVDELFGKIKAKFVDNGFPVIIGEYGAMKNKTAANEDFRRYYIEYVTKAAANNGLIPIWWDNGYDGSSGEAFALFNRTSYKVLHEDIIEAIMRAKDGGDYEITLPEHKE